MMMVGLLLGHQQVVDVTLLSYIRWPQAAAPELLSADRDQIQRGTNSTAEAGSTKSAEPYGGLESMLSERQVAFVYV
jgi:hypothetical protein